MIHCPTCGSIPSFLGLERIGIIKIGKWMTWCNMKCYIGFKGFNT